MRKNNLYISKRIIYCSKYKNSWTRRQKGRAAPQRYRGVASLLAREVHRARKTKLLRHINHIRSSFADRDGHGTDGLPDERQRDSIKW